MLRDNCPRRSGPRRSRQSRGEEDVIETHSLVRAPGVGEAEAVVGAARPHMAEVAGGVRLALPERRRVADRDLVGGPGRRAARVVGGGDGDLVAALSQVGVAVAEAAGGARDLLVAVDRLEAARAVGLQQGAVDPDDLTAVRGGRLQSRPPRPPQADLRPSAAGTKPTGHRWSRTRLALAARFAALAVHVRRVDPTRPTRAAPTAPAKHSKSLIKRRLWMCTS
jgi:hypothetical protein